MSGDAEVPVYGEGLSAGSADIDDVGDRRPDPTRAVRKVRVIRTARVRHTVRAVRTVRAARTVRAVRRQREHGVIRFGRGVYQQTAAVFGAFGVAAIIGHFWSIGWKGWLQTLVGVWDDTVRPVMAWLLHYLVTVPLSWVGLEFEVPLLVRDYLSVGMIFAMSYRRAGPDDLLHTDWRRISVRVFVWPWASLLYVIDLFWALRALIGSLWRERRPRWLGGARVKLKTATDYGPWSAKQLFVINSWLQFQVLTPLIYLVLLIGVNALFL